MKSSALTQYYKINLNPQTSIAFSEKGFREINLNSELEKFKKMVEESQGIYEKMLEKTTQSLEEIIKNTENNSKVQ